MFVHVKASGQVDCTVNRYGKGKGLPFGRQKEFEIFQILWDQAKDIICTE